VILSNVRLDRGAVVVELAGERISSELRKFGAIVGDYTEIGCNSAPARAASLAGIASSIPAHNGAVISPPTAF